jgi:hypothetical protein
MKKTLVLLVGIFLLSSCKVGCDVENVVTSGLANAIASALNCSNVTQIQADVQAIVGKANICSVKPDTEKRGTIANIVCPMVSQAMVTYVGTQIPVSWNCGPTVAGQSLSSIVTSACELLPF